MVSQKAASLAPSETLAIAAKANALKAQGINVVAFTAGELDFDTPVHIKDAAKKALDEGFTRYTAASGILELRQAIADKLKRENKCVYSADEVIVGAGGKQVLYNIMIACLNPGDEVIIPKPYWLSYPEMVRLADGVPVFVEEATAASIGEKITDRTRLVVLNSPSNPTGQVISEDELRKIASLCLVMNVLIISDEVYEHFMYDGARHFSIASISPSVKEITFTVNSMSKSYAMTGWRIGYAAGPLPYIKAMSAFQSHTTSNPNSIAQKAALAALTGQQEFIAKAVNDYDVRRRIMVEGLNSILGIQCPTPKGAFYCFADIYALLKNGQTAADFISALLEKAHVAVIPGNPFGAPTSIRLSYATSEQNIREGIKRMKAFVENNSI